MLTAGTGKRYELQIVIGGTGGASGSGGSTTVTHTGDIFTHGRHSDGLLAQSIGGGGGNADWNIAAGLNPNTSGINLAVGGAPGDGGSGGSVMVNHTGYIGTAYDDSSAIFAQSVGGGGGDASFDMASSLLSSNTLDLGLGRTGGTGGTGGNVHVSSDGTLMTAGIRSVGLLAQSVGNGGGRSGAISVGVSSSSGKGTAEKSVGANIAIGLEGGDGGIGGAVDVHAKGTIKTEGAKSHALHAQSVGGGGGIGGAATNIIFRETASVKVGVGGTGGTGSFGGKVTVTSSATVRTEGAESHGILAQSIGGGGGTGGYAGLVGIQTGGAAANGNSGLGVSVGGSGGTGGAGGQVVVENMGAITTTGADSLGVFAESIGGGGGDGGLVINGTVAGKGRGTNLTVGIGGAGGNGGVGGAVDVTNGGNGVITTSGIGIFAQSIGGGGGNAGLVANIEISKPAADASSTSLTINIGGAGGTGGTGGNVDVENLAGGQIRTSGSKAYGVFAQSIGGGGGNGSSVVSANFSSGSKNTTLIGLNIGGSGGDGGHGGVVTVTNEGTIETSGDDAHGVFAQSIAGGGGNGGLSLATNGVLRRGGGKATPLVTVGGAGGNGEDAGNVTVTGTGKIVTSGANAHGIVAQSIGGGGGNAGVGIGLTSDVKSTAFANTLSFAVGGVRDLLLGGASGGKGGKVKVDYAGDIEINGAGSEAIKAESINGGGGGLVLDFDGITSLPGGAALPGIPGVGGPEDATDPALTIRAGGEGQMNTDAGAVTVSHTGNVMKGGNTNSVAVSQMSIGGGGGTVYAKVNLATPLAATTTGQLALDVVLGGANGTNNSGNVIDSSHVGDIVTTGSHTRGVALQSIGGGGGRGIVSVTGAVETLGAVTLALGGTNGTTEMGGAVSYSRTGALTTSGDGSDGVLLQSIGGGGGSLDLRVGGGALATAVALAGAAGPTSAALLTGAVTLGAAGGSALHGGGVSATLTGDVTTVGAGALGVVVQSIGAGGGAARMTGSPGLTVMLGGSAGATGDGGTIAIEHTGAVTTSGDHAHGLFAQSIGGGGAVFSPGGPVTVSAANAGDGGDLTLVQTGHITTTGAGAFGVFAQSLGGGGGYVAGLGALSAGGLGSGGAISLTLEGSVKALAESSTAVYLHSAGVAGSGDIGVVLKAGSSLVGGALGTAVSFDGGADNRLTNHGVVTSTAGVAGWTVLGTSGNETVDNFGRLVGSIDLGGGTNAVTNTATGWVESGAQITLGAGGVFTNEGTFVPGGMGVLQTTALTGTFVQSGTPTWLFDIGEIGQSDRLTVSGIAQLGSSVTTVNLHEITTPTQSGHYTLLSAPKGGLLGAQFELGSLDGPMPIGQTFTLVNSDTAQQLSVLPSTGAFVWNGATSNTWSSPFLNGGSNWTRGSADTEFIFGTPGVASDVFFPGTGSRTRLGADFVINSLTITSGGPVLGQAVPGGGVHIGGRPSLTLAARGRAGITLSAGAPNTTIGVPVILGANQRWVNNSAGLLQVNGPTITGDNRNLSVGGPGRTHIGAAIQTGSGSLTKAGEGILSLSGANSYSGATRVEGGTLAAGTTQVFSPNSAFTVGTGAALELAGFDQAIGSLAGAGAVRLGSAVLVTGGNDASTTYGGTISGNGLLVKVGTGTFNLAGANRYTGGTWIEGGTLLGTTTSLVGAILNEAALVFDQSTEGTFGGSVFGSGTLTKQGSGTVTFSGANSHSGATRVVGGILAAGAMRVVGGILAAGAMQVFSPSSAFAVGAGAALELAGFDQAIGSLAGAGAVRLGSAVLVTGGNDASTTYGGVMSGSGGLVKVGTGTFNLAGANSYTGGTWVVGGTLLGTTTSLVGAILNEAALVFDQSTEGTFGGSVFGSGTLTKQGSGTVTFSGANSYSGATRVEGGTLAAGAKQGFSPNSAFTVADGAALELAWFNQAIGSLAGAGAVRLRSALLLTGGNDASTTYGGTMSGSGGLVKVGTGTFNLAGANSYAGATWVAGGTLAAGAAQVFSPNSTFAVADGAALELAGFDQAIGSLAGAGAVRLGSAVLTTGGNDASTTYWGAISGSGGLVKAGSGVLVLTGINTYAGDTTVAAGHLLVTGSIGGQGVRVLRGGVLGGTGLVPTMTLTSGGVLAPGLSIGTLRSSGDVQFDAGSVYQVQTASYGGSDLTVAAGDLLAGGTVEVRAGGRLRYRPINQYTIFTSDAISGLFAGVTSNLAFLNPSLQYDAQNVYLTLRRNDVDFRATGTQGNQTGVAVMLNQLVGTATGALADVVNNVYDLYDGQARQAMTSMSGILHQRVARTSLTSAQTFMGINMTRIGVAAAGQGDESTGLAVNRSSSGRAGVSFAGERRLGWWVSGLGGVTTLQGTAADPGGRAPSAQLAWTRRWCWMASRTAATLAPCRGGSTDGIGRIGHGSTS